MDKRTQLAELITQLTFRDLADIAADLTDMIHMEISDQFDGANLANTILEWAEANTEEGKQKAA